MKNKLKHSSTVPAARPKCPAAEEVAEEVEQQAPSREFQKHVARRGQCQGSAGIKMHFGSRVEVLLERTEGSFSLKFAKVHVTCTRRNMDPDPTL